MDKDWGEGFEIKSKSSLIGCHLIEKSTSKECIFISETILKYGTTHHPKSRTVVTVEIAGIKKKLDWNEVLVPWRVK